MRPAAPHAAARALASWCVFVVALAAAGLCVAALESVLADAPPALVKVLPAVITSGVTVPLLLLLHRRGRAALALRRPGQAATGIVVTLACAFIVFAPAVMAGWIDITTVRLTVLIPFLVTNLALALSLEAIPEELTFRGSMYGSLRSVLRPGLATLVTTAGFVVAPGASIALTAGAGQVLSLPTPAPTFAPNGQDPVAYAVLLAVFGIVLVLARVATSSLWTAVGVHLTFLTVNRLLFRGGDSTGVTTTAYAGSELLVLVYLGLAGAAFASLGRFRNRSRSASTRSRLHT